MRFEDLLSEPLKDKLAKIRENAKPLLDKINEIFPEDTIHDIRHSEEVIRNLDRIVPDELKKAMKGEEEKQEWEIWFLLCAAILHDIGMISFNSIEKIDQARLKKEHNIRSEKYINDHYRELGLEDHHQARIVGRICRGHKELPDDKKLYDPFEKYGGQNINVPFLVMLLQVADDLDLTFKRAPLEIYEKFSSKLKPFEKVKWERQILISDWGLSPTGGKRIEIGVECCSPELHETFKILEDEIQRKIDALKYYLYHYNKYESYIPVRIEINVKPIGYSPIRQRELVGIYKDTLLIFEVRSAEDLYKVANNSFFMQNKENFKLKRERILHIDESKIKDTMDRLLKALTPQTIVLLTGKPAVGKTTQMLHFLERSIEEGLANWQKIFFLNPSEEYLLETLQRGIIDSKFDPSKTAHEDILLVIDALYRGERNEAEKITKLFKEVKEKRYRLIATIRDHELEQLKNLLGEEWIKFENDIVIEKITPDRDLIKPVLIKLLKEYKSQFKSLHNLSSDDLENYFASESFNEIAKLIAEKSKGVIGYVVYLIRDLAGKGEISKERIEREYPEDLTKLIMKIIETDFKIEGCKTLPTLILFLAEQKDYLSYEFIKSFLKWGLSEIDKGKFPLEEAIERIKILLESYTVKRKESNITLYRLLSHWRDAINEFSNKILPWEEVKKHVKPRLLDFIYTEFEGLKKGTITPESDYDIFVTVGDIASLMKEKEILQYALETLLQYQKYKETDQYQFLKGRIAFLLKEAALKELSRENYTEGLPLVMEGLKINPNDAYFYYLASKSQIGLRDFNNALKNCKKAIEIEPKNVEYRILLCDIFEENGQQSWRLGNHQEAIEAFREALGSYKKVVETFNNLHPSIRGCMKKEESNVWWRIGRCNRRVRVIRREFDYASIQELRNYLRDMCEKSFRGGIDDELEGNYDRAIEKLTEAKDLILEYIDTIDIKQEEELLKEISGLVSKIYEHLGFCYERKPKPDFEKASNAYLIFSHLNEYTPGSVKRYLKFANKFRRWGLYVKTIHCLGRALKFKQNDYAIMSELGEFYGKIGNISQELKYTKKALEVQKATAGVLTESDLDLLSICEERLKNKEKIAKALCSLCEVAELAIDNAQRYQLSRALCKAAKLIGKLNPLTIADPDQISRKDIIDSITNELRKIRVSCLCWAICLNKKNYRALNELELITQRSYEENFKEYGSYYRLHLKKDIKNPLDAMCRIFSQAVYTMRLLYKTRKQITAKKKIKKAGNILSAYWGWIGGRINRIYRDPKMINKISPNVGVKCFELSLKLRERNKKSSNGRAWALLHAERHEEAIKAFELDLKEINRNNPASMTGIGRAYEEKGNYIAAAEYIKTGAKLRFELRYDEKPSLVLEQLAKAAEGLENLAFHFGLSQRLKILQGALEIYEWIGEIMNEVKLEKEQIQQEEEEIYRILEDDQNLLKLKMLNLQDYVKNLENQMKHI